MLKIEKNIPIPEKNNYGKYYDIFCKMEFGDSVFFKSDKLYVNNELEASNFLLKYRNYIRKHGKGNESIIHRKVKDGFRIWLVKKDDA